MSEEINDILDTMSNSSEIPESSTSESAPKELTQEDKARQQGWRPKSQYHGDPDLWVDAKEFLYRGSYLKRIKQLESAVDAATQVAIKARQDMYQKALQDLESQKASAHALADTVRLEQIITKEQELKRTAPQQANTPAQELPEFKEFASNNPWMQQTTPKAKAMKVYAKEVGEEFERANPMANPKEIFDYIQDQVREEFSEQFKETKPKVAGINMTKTGTTGEGESTPSPKNLEVLVQKLSNNPKTAAIGMIVKQMKLNDPTDKKGDIQEYLKEMRRQKLL